MKNQWPLQEYIDLIKEQQCCLVVDQRQKIISKLSQSELMQEIVLKDNSQTIICDMKVVNISSVNDFTYSIQLKGKDLVGASNLRRILIFKGSGFGLKLSKEYENIKSAGQTGNYVILMYEGEGDLEIVEGTWEFQGHKDTEKHSGTQLKLPIDLRTQYYLEYYHQHIYKNSFNMYHLEVNNAEQIKVLYNLFASVPPIHTYLQSIEEAIRKFEEQSLHQNKILSKIVYERASL